MIQIEATQFSEDILNIMHDILSNHSKAEVIIGEGKKIILSSDTAYQEEYEKNSLKTVNPSLPPDLAHLSPEEWEELEDEILLEMAEERLKNSSPDDIISFEDMLKKYGLTEADLEDFDEDDILLEIAEERMKNTDPSTWISQETLMAEFGITEKDLEGWENIEFE